VVGVVEDKMENCLICEKEIFSSIGKGCQLCGMPLDTKNSFCCSNCEITYKQIKRGKL
jgi:hypothetical protein